MRCLLLALVAGFLASPGVADELEAQHPAGRPVADFPVVVIDPPLEHDDPYEDILPPDVPYWEPTQPVREPTTYRPDPHPAPVRRME